MTLFEFHAEIIVPQAEELSISFADRTEDQKHYLIIARDQESPDETQPDLKNIYIERDDQRWGGYGGIESVRLERDALTVRLSGRMATRIGLHDELRVTFGIDGSLFRDVKSILELIFRGYEDRLHCIVRD